jgi:cyclic beta-1,2-glucan synthetase
VHVLSLEGRPQGPVEWETDRARFLGRGRGPEDPQALDGRSLSGTTGPCSIPSSASASASASPRRLRAAVLLDGMAQSRETALALAQKYHDPSAVARTFALAFVHAQSGLAHLGITSEEALLFERLASRVLYADTSLRADPDVLARNVLGQEGLWPHSISGDLPILLVRVVEEDDLPLVRQVLQAQEYWRPQGPQRGRRDPERAPHQLPRRDARGPGGAAGRRAVAIVEASARRRLPPARRAHGRRRSGRSWPAWPGPS